MSRRPSVARRVILAGALAMPAVAPGRADAWDQPAYTVRRTETDTVIPDVRLARFGGGYLWLGGVGSVHRVAAGGKTEEVVLPERFAVSDVHPYGRSALVSAGRSVMRVTGSAVATIAILPQPVRATVPVRGGAVALTATRLYDLRGREPLSISVRTPGESAPAADDPAPRHLTLDETSTLFLVDEDTFGVLNVEPYEAWLVKLDGNAKLMAIDDSGSLAPRDAVEAHLLEKDWTLGSTRTTKTLFASVQSGEIAVARELGYRYRRPDVPDDLARSFPFVDWIDLDTGKVRGRTFTPRIKDAGLLAGARGKDLVFYYLPGPDVKGSIAIATPSR